MTQIITLVGNLGAGKTTLAKVLGMIVKFYFPDALVVSNVEMGNGIKKVDDVHKFIAQKLVYQDKTYAFVIDDEAAQAGLESRGSGSKGAALESRIITHARKAHVDLVLISQLKSMIDKRAQWVEDISILCEAQFKEGNTTTTPNYFHYTVYNEELDVINEFDLETDEMKEHVWPGMNTDDIPFFEAFKSQMADYYSIDDSGKSEFNSQIGIPKPTKYPLTFLNGIAIRMEGERQKPQSQPTSSQKRMLCRYCEREGLEIPIIWDKKTKVAIEEKTGEDHDCPNKPSKKKTVS